MASKRKTYVFILAIIVALGAVGMVAVAQAQCDPTDLMCLTTP
jgi:hypothetical protein